MGERGGDEEGEFIECLSVQPCALLGDQSGWRTERRVASACRQAEVQCSGATRH